MKQTTLLIFIVFAFILNSCGQSNSKTESIDNSELINIVGTKVLFPKSSFTESKELVGLVNDNDAMILVTELLNDSFESQANNLNKAFIERSGGEILDTKQYLIDGFNAKQLIVRSPDSLKIRMVLFGDNEFCTFLTAKHFLNDEKSEKEIEFLLENVKYDKSIVVNPLALSPFIIDGNYSGFKHFTKSQNTHFYTRDGNERKNREKDPSLAIVYGVLRNESDFEQTFKQLTKQMLHSDELPYFVCGKNQSFLTINGVKIAIGICYETLQREHFLNVINQGTDIYIASVAKPKGGIEKAYKHFPQIANEFNTPILMSNCVGHCDNFISVGQSAVWNKKGELLEQLDDNNVGLLIYDTKTEKTEKEQLKIEKGTLSDLNELFQIYLNAKNELERNGIYQWTNNYPTRSIIENDLKKGILFVLRSNEEIIGAINISEEQETEYQTVSWEFNNSKVLVIHRLVIDPKYQGKGYAKKMMDFAEKFANENNYSSIRLDAYSQNKRVINFYEKREYFIRGNVNFPEREYLFHCMEKEIITAYNIV